MLLLFPSVVHALRGRWSIRRIIPAREGIPMQSSLWKLLTAAGIIGIGTLVVLEVQTRLPVPTSSGGVVAVQATGTELSVTPDATTAFDEAMFGSDSARRGTSDPAQYDKPGVGVGRPAPPADDSRFFGAVEDRPSEKTSCLMT